MRQADALYSSVRDMHDDSHELHPKADRYLEG